MSLKKTFQTSEADKHEYDITHLIYHKGKLYSASDDGKVKLWTQDLKKLAEVQAHPCSVFCLAANDDILFSCSNDGTIKLWDLETLSEKETLVSSDKVEFWRVGYSAGCLFAGDDQGNISVYKNRKLYGQVNIAEPIKDMTIHGTFVFTVKDLDLVVNEIKLEGEKIQYGTKISFMGRSPVTLIGDDLFAFVTREGKDIQLHENSVQSKFKQVARVPHGTDMIINAMAGTKWGDQELLFTGGWDKLLKLWKITRIYPINEASVDLGVVINAITCGEKNQIYVGDADGHVIRVDAS